MGNSINYKFCLGENDIAELLVKRGANLSAQRFSYCEEDYNINNHKMMCRDPMRPLDMVVARRDCHMLETMLGHSNWTISAIVAAVNEPAPSSRPANEFPRWPVLENAIEMGLVDCVRVLLAHGANASAELFSWGRRFETPLIKAARERPALIRLLIEQGGLCDSTSYLFIFKFIIISLMLKVHSLTSAIGWARLRYTMR
jgi:ankyrin repeat protein